MNPNLSSEVLESMNFLNEVIERFPEAISFASGRPDTRYADFWHWKSLIESTEGFNQSDYSTELMSQYGPTQGLFNQTIARLLNNDESFEVNAEDILITNGCQEALSICTDVLFTQDETLLIIDPTYVGAIGICKIRGVNIESCEISSGSLLEEQIVGKIDQCKEQGKPIKALYVIPDHANPLGDSISLSSRIALIEICAKHNIFIIEDAAYRCFQYSGSKLPIMATLDTYGIVIHIGSFAKTICPGLRLGYIVCSSKNGHTSQMVELLSKVKSFTTLNTPPFNQAVVATILEQNGYSLTEVTKPAVQNYKKKLKLMSDSLDNYLNRTNFKSSGIYRNKPSGGFFLNLEIPFEFGMKQVEKSAGEYGVICLPVSLFSINNRFKNRIRLSFSYVKSDQIEEGCSRLANYIESELKLQA